MRLAGPAPPRLKDDPVMPTGTSNMIVRTTLYYYDGVIDNVVASPRPRDTGVEEAMTTSTNILTWNMAESMITDIPASSL